MKRAAAQISGRSVGSINYTDSLMMSVYWYEM